jgi:alkylation response protein AidB-like acyl-CoA dehydrogenase
MRFSLTRTQHDLIAEVDAILTDDLVADPRKAFAVLGDARLLAVHYPAEFGGRGLALTDHAVVAEHLGMRGLPDEVHLVTVQGVGCPLLTVGSPEQRDRWLPDIASGRCFASLLLSERGAGSELAAVATTAEPAANGYVIRGRKSWSLHADWSSVGLCSARTRPGNRYDGISLLVVPLDAPGITITPVPRATGEPYFDVSFDDVHVPTGAVVGTEHRGWATIVRAIGFERAGFDYLCRARRWLRAAEEVVKERPGAQTRLRHELVQLDRAVAAARALAFRAVSGAGGFDMDEVDTAYAKLACGEVAQRVAWWAATNLGIFPRESGDRTRSHRDELFLAAVEAPELSVSGGASELLLDLIANSLRSPTASGV